MKKLEGMYYTPSLQIAFNPPRGIKISPLTIMQNMRGDIHQILCYYTIYLTFILFNLNHNFLTKKLSSTNKDSKKEISNVLQEEL